MSHEMKQPELAGNRAFLQPKMTGDLFQRRFSSDEVAILTGVSPEKQRLWRTRGLVSFEFDRKPVREGRSVFIGWRDVIQWALVGEVIRYGIEIEAACYFAGAPRFREIAHKDLRNFDSPHFFAVCRPTAGDNESFGNVFWLVENLHADIGFLGRFFFAVDFSAVQAAVVQRLETL